MKITFIYPKFDKFLETYPELAEMPAIAATWAFRMPPALAIPILINILPDEVSWRVIDENIEEVDFDDNADLFAISFFTPQAAYAYAIGDELKARGKKVIMGGMHPSMIPEDCAPHCNAVCIGEADLLWPEIIRDVAHGTLRKIYRNDAPPEPHQIASPRKGVFDIEEKYDWHASLVSITRGCPFSCDWCNVPHYQGNRIRLRPIEHVVREIRELSGREFYITDDMIMLNRPRIQRHMMELCERIREFNVSMFLSCSPAMNTDPHYLDAIAAAGAKSMYTVFASDPISARFYARHKGIWQRTIDLVHLLEDRGIRFFGSFGVGFDTCFADQFDLILEFCEKAQVKTAEFFIATPFPNTSFWHRISSGNRFLTTDWKKFNCANVVFTPKATTVKELRDGFIMLWKEFFTKNNPELAHNTFNQKLENILKSKEYSQTVKNAVARGLAKHSILQGGSPENKGDYNE
jgi:radical SAM superfamily enzyme YgiQ (UPF0313 family)